MSIIGFHLFSVIQFPAIQTDHKWVMRKGEKYKNYTKVK